jgi:murein DD-endopeptidase MepM/ murein hydrolase activator NlpD
MRRAMLSLACISILATQSVSGLCPLYAQPAPGTLDFDPASPPTQTLVMRGETLFNIAERTRAPIQGIIRANTLEPPYAIQPGQVLRLPPLKVHVVQAGETFQAIAARYSVDARSLSVFNRLRRPVALTTGQRIILPPMVIDRLTGLEPQDLVDLLANEINAGRTVTGSIPGQIVVNTQAVPPSGSPSSPNPSQGPQRDSTITDAPLSPQSRPAQSVGPAEDENGVLMTPKQQPRPPATTPTPPPRPKGLQTATLPPPPRPLPPPTLPLPSISDAPVPSMAGVFAWPVLGRIVETFGTKRDLRVLDWIEIEAPAGAPFKAAAAGTIVYVGNQLPGYGWLVLIRHNEGLMSAYAYAQSVNVRENQAVSKGEVIGLVGTTGRAITPRLHFQIRFNTRPVDPLPRLPRVRTAA